MTTIFVTWVIFPLVICILSLGCGLLLEQASGFRLPGTLVLPAGFAVLTLVAQLATISPATARLGVPAVASLAALGLMFSFPLTTPVNTRLSRSSTSMRDATRFPCTRPAPDLRHGRSSSWGRLPSDRRLPMDR